MNNLNIELKNIKHAEFASQETNCYEATVYLDGEKFCHVSNEGHGGCDEQHEIAPNTWDDVMALNELIGETYDACLFNHGAVKIGEKPYSMVPAGTEGALKASLETICGDMVNDWLIMKDIKKDMRYVCTFDGKSVSKWGKLKDNKSQIKSWLANNKPDLKILNDLPLDEAVAIFKRVA